jgi:hypothetical protein
VVARKQMEDWGLRVQFLGGTKVFNSPQRGSRNWDPPNLIRNNNGSALSVRKIASKLS